MKSYQKFAMSSSPQTIHTVIVIDESGSMSDSDFYPSRLDGAVQATEDLISTKRDKRPQDIVSLLGFSDSAYIHANGCNVVKNNAEISHGLQQYHPRGETNFYKGLQLAQRMFDENAPSNSHSFLKMLNGYKISKGIQKHLIFLSDGDNTGGDPTPLTDALKQAGVIINCIGVGGDPYYVNEELLIAMASTNQRGDACYRFISDTSALITDFKRMATLQIID